MWGFFFQAEDGIRDGHVTGVQTCALPISLHLTALGSVRSVCRYRPQCRQMQRRPDMPILRRDQIGRASCRERGWSSVLEGVLKAKSGKRVNVEKDEDEHTNRQHRDG